MSFLVVRRNEAEDAQGVFDPDKMEKLHCTVAVTLDDIEKDIMDHFEVKKCTISLGVVSDDSAKVTDDEVKDVKEVMTKYAAPVYSKFINYNHDDYSRLAPYIQFKITDSALINEENSLYSSLSKYVMKNRNNTFQQAFLDHIMIIYIVGKKYAYRIYGDLESISKDFTDEDNPFLLLDFHL